MMLYRVIFKNRVAIHRVGNISKKSLNDLKECQEIRGEGVEIDSRPRVPYFFNLAG